jgi:chemotaxis protein CheY-P-specific phosphatase CheC
MRKITEKWLNEFANAFYDENYKKMSKMLGKKVRNLYQAELELEKFKDKLRKVV